MNRKLILVFLKTSALVTFGNACGYLVQLVLARSLVPSDYGAVNAMLAISMTVIAPVAVAPMVIAKLLIEHNAVAVRNRIIAQVVAAALGLCVLVWVLLLPLTGLIMRTMGVNHHVAAVMLPLLATSIILYHVPLGIWQGQHYYMRMAAGTAAIPIIRLVAALALVAAAGTGLVGALWSLALGGIFVFLWGVWDARKQLTAAREAPPKGTFPAALEFGAPASLCMLGLLGLAYVDQPIVRALASPEVSGYYAAASTLAKISLLLPAALTGVVFPEAARLGRQGGSQQHSMRLIVAALLFTVMVSGAASLVMFMAPQFVIGALAGSAYLPAASILVLLAPAMTCLAVVTLIVTYALARGVRLLLVPLILAVLGVVVPPLAFGFSPHSVALLMLSVLATLSAACILWLVMTHPPRINDLLESVRRARPTGGLPLLERRAGASRRWTRRLSAFSIPLRSNGSTFRRE